MQQETQEIYQIKTQAQKMFMDLFYSSEVQEFLKNFQNFLGGIERNF